MKIRIEAEKVISSVCEIEVPDEILEESKDKLSKTYLKQAIHNWIDENYSYFQFDEYCSHWNWTTWEEEEGSK